jgi:hypothetical protein
MSPQKLRIWSALNIFLEAGWFASPTAIAAAALAVVK